MTLSEQSGLKPELILKIQTALFQFDAIESVVLYGSRAKGNYKIGSDIDLSIKTNGNTDQNLLSQVIGAIDDLELIYGFDISLFAYLNNPNLIEHINRVGIVFYNKNVFKKQQQKEMQQKNYAKQSHQSEQALEDNLVKQLASLGHHFVKIKDEKDLLANLKTQLEKHNQLTLTDGEFSKVLNQLNKGNIFEKAKILRDRIRLEKENGESVYLQLINQEHWCKNQFQVTQQVSLEGTYKNRYDVTLLINGLPLVQIELKRRGLELKEAFNQINRYQKHSYFSGSGLFNYIQIFIISNGVNSKYYTNNRKLKFEQSFYWADEDNKNITQLEEFTDVFLEKCHLAKMITQYIVLNETQKILMVLRPYQYYATEAIINRVKESDKNGYIWHTTGSGKTLTSFKTSQLLMTLPQIHKVMFVVDRKDLDYQTIKEFKAFSEGSVDGTNNTKNLVHQLTDTYKNNKGELKDHKLIVTTIQKLNTAIKNPKYLSKMDNLKNKKIVFIFDECHRSQFGETHNRIKNFFQNHQLFGFTGTPIFIQNAVIGEKGKRTTKELFHDCLHKYVITDAIKDENVLKFSIEYVGNYKYKSTSKNALDIDVEGVDTKELIESDTRLEKITDYIIAHHHRKTHSRDFTAMFCVSSIDSLTRYYDLFKSKKLAGKHNLTIATIFSFVANEADKEANGFIPDVELEIKNSGSLNQHSRDKLDSYIADYNALFNESFSTKNSQGFYSYYNDIAEKVKKKKVDILLVVNMFLTGFDSPPLNTLYVDKNLKYHGLIQAFSRTNRILGEKKSQGNIICFRNLKKATDEAIALFSDKEAKETILVEPYESYIEKFNKAFSEMLKIAPTFESVNDLGSEEQELAFIKAFRELMRLKNVLLSFADFEFNDLEMEAQSFEDYKSKYLDLRDKVKRNHTKEKVSILDDVDFELELIHRDDINVSYILKLLANFKSYDIDMQEKQQKIILDLLTGDVKLRSKKALIEKFINENLIEIKTTENIEVIFHNFWEQEKQRALVLLCEQEDLNFEKLQKVIKNYLYTNRKPLRDDIVAILNHKPKLLQRKKIVLQVTDKIINFVDTFIDEISGI